MDIQELAEKIQKEGIEKAEEQAKNIIEKAKKEAEEIINNAKKEAEEIINNAKKEAESILENGKQNLKLSARDILLQLHQDVSAILQAIITRDVNNALSKKEVIKELLLTLVKTYENCPNAHIVEINIAEDLKEKIKDVLTNELKVEIKTKKKLNGFTLKEKDGGELEVTPESVQEVLTPFLKGVVKEVLKGEKIK